MLAPESTLNERYRITYVVEERPDGVIYRAIDNHASLRVLIAELPQPTESAIGDVGHLASQIAGVTAPGLLSLRDHFALGLSYYLVADDPGGQDLERVARDRGGPIPEAEVLGNVDRLLGALDQFHSRTPPLVMGDLRSTDLWSSLDGGLFLAPFPLVRHFSSDVSPYRAPELGEPQAEPTTAGDIYAIGAVLYQLLTGWAPPPAAQRQSGTPLNSPRMLNGRVSALAEQLVLRALELKPANRYQQAREMRSALETVRLMAGRPLGALAPLEPGQPAPTPPAPTQPAPAMPPRSGAPEAGAAYGPPPPAPPPGWAGTSPGIPQVQQPQWGGQPPAPQPAGWQTVPPTTAPPAPARRMGIPNGCLIALVALLAVLALGICVAGAWLGWLIMQSGGSLPVLPGAAATTGRATVGPATPNAPPTADQGSSPGTGRPTGAAASLTQAEAFTTTRQLKDPSVGAVLYSPDGATIAVGVGGTIELRDATSLDPGRTLKGHTGDISALAFDPDGRLLASGAQDENEVIVWDAASGRELRRLEGHKGWIRSLAFSPDGSLLASGSTDQTIIFWDPQSGRQIRVLEGHADFLGNIAFSPDGATLASASRDGTVRLWEVASGKQRNEFQYTAPPNPNTGAPYWLTGISFSPDGNTLAVGSISGSVYILDPATGRLQRELQGHDGWVVIRGVSFSPDGRLLASASLDGTVHLWNPGTGADRGTLQQRGLRLLGLAWSPEGDRIVTSSDTAGNVAVWDVRTQKVAQSALLGQGAVTTIVYSDSGNLLASGGANGSVKVHILADDRQVPLSGGAPTNQYIAFLSDTRLVAVSDAGDVVVIDLTGGANVQQLEGLNGFALGVIVSRDRRLIAAGNERGDVTIWDAATLDVSRTLRGLGGPVYTLAFSGDGALLTAVTNDPAERPRAIVWDVQSGDRRSTFSNHTAPVYAIDMPAGEGLVASASGDGTIRLWEAASGNEVRVLKIANTGDWYNSVAFSPDGSLLIAGTVLGEVEFWNPATGKQVGGFNLQGGSILAIAVHPDGKQVAVATRDEGVYLLEPQR